MNLFMSCFHLNVLVCGMLCESWGVETNYRQDPIVGKLNDSLCGQGTRDGGCALRKEPLLRTLLQSKTQCKAHPQTETSVQKTERGYKNQFSWAQKARTRVQKASTRVHSPKPPFYTIALLLPLEKGDSVLRT